VDQRLLSGRVDGERGAEGRARFIDAMLKGSAFPGLSGAEMPLGPHLPARASVVPDDFAAHVISRVYSSRARAPDVVAARVSPDDVAELVRILIERDCDAPAFVGSICVRGVAFDDIVAGLLTPAARALQSLWAEDSCDFVGVTIGLGRLQSVLRTLAVSMRESPFRSEAEGRAAILAAVPGEQHTFGLDLLAETFRRAGWRVLAARRLSAARLVAAVRREAFSMIGFSIASERRLDSLVGLIRTIRRSSRNRCINVMVGGSLLIEHPEYLDLVGANATAADARDALTQANDRFNNEMRPD
jgi:methanogenic corrinoid protein MtbC1